MDIEIFKDNGKVYADVYLDDKLSGINKIVDNKDTEKTLNFNYNNFNIFIFTYKDAGSQKLTDTIDYKNILNKYPNTTVGYVLPDDITKYDLIIINQHVWGTNNPSYNYIYQSGVNLITTGNDMNNIELYDRDSDVISSISNITKNNNSILANNLSVSDYSLVDSQAGIKFKSDIIVPYKGKDENGNIYDVMGIKKGKTAQWIHTSLVLSIDSSFATRNLPPLVDYIARSNGTQFEISSSGDYTFYGYDNAGNVIEKKVNIDITAPELGTTWTFDYTGGEQTFTVPVSGIYKLETWGAQGGSVNIPMSATPNIPYSNVGIGGYGGYSMGTIELMKSDQLYINVGESGKNCKGPYCYSSKSYNGGGSCKAYGSESNENAACGSGGGATHISFSPGLLSSLENNKDNIIIVAGGGGGANYCNDWNFASGGSGGGYKGGNAINIGARDFEVNGGTAAVGGSQTNGYIFGQGYFSNESQSTAIVGGGGGFYGGIGSSINGAGGGSGYIGNKSLSEKIMNCYNCEKSDDENIKTIPTTCTNETPSQNCNKQGNGYARITLISY